MCAYSCLARAHNFTNTHSHTPKKKQVTTTTKVPIQV